MGTKIKHRNSHQLMGYRTRLVRAMNCSQDGVMAEIELKTARALIEIIDQTIHVEINHEQPVEGI